MKVVQWFAILVSIIGVKCTEHLRYTALLYRHGDRTPVDPYPTDPYKNESLWPVKFGQLTNKGKLQHYKFGHWLHSRYVDLVTSNYDPDLIYVRSTDVDRTIMSAVVNLAGMFMPTNASAWMPGLAWTPFPVHTTPVKDDKVLAMQKQCQVYDSELLKLQNSDEYKQALSKYAPLMKYLSYYTGEKVNDYVKILDIYSVLKIDKIYNLELPKWTNSVFPFQMAEPACHAFSVQTATKILARLKIGPLMTEIIGAMTKTMHYHNAMQPYHFVKYNDLDGKPPFKMNIYSGHDLTIGNVLGGLGIYDGKCPEYTAAIMIELVYDDAAQIHFVKIFYRNSVDNVEPKNLYIPSCGYRCPLEMFRKLYEHLLVENWEEECGYKSAVEVILNGYLPFHMMMGIIIVYFFLRIYLNAEKRRLLIAANDQDENVVMTYPV